MDATIILHVVVAPMLLLTATEAVLPNGECFVEDMTCELDNAIGIINGVASAEDCKQQCEDNSTDCRVYSYYGQAGAPFRETCLIFNDCPVLDPCEDCFTEEVICVFCNAPAEGILGENLIDFVVDTTEIVCQQLCEADEKCKFFTFHYESSSLYPKTCFLLKTSFKMQSLQIESTSSVSSDLRW